MSRRESGFHHDSRPPSGSPGSEDRGSRVATGHVPSTLTGGDWQNDRANIAPSDADHRIQEAAPRAGGMQTFLNPTEQRIAPAEGSSSGPPPFLPRNPAPAARGISPRHYTGNQPFFGVGQQPGSHPGTPGPPAVPFGLVSPSGRKSPGPTYPFPTMNSPRRILSPKLPRNTSLGHGQAMREMDPRQPPFIPSPSPAKRPYESETVEDRGQVPGFQQLTGLHRPLTASETTPKRSFSQPATRHLGGMPGPASPAPLRDPQLKSPAIPPRTQHEHPAAQPLPASAMPPIQEAPTWKQDQSQQSRLSLALTGPERQQTFMSLPGSDEPIQIEVDYHQGSRKADEKRRNNAKASTRHRRKKKSMEEERKRELEDQKDINQELQQAIDELIQHRNFYRDERNRLRDIVARTQGISDQAAGPPSPTLMRDAQSLMQSSPMVQATLQTLPQGQGSESERPTQRRRTEDYSDQASMFGALPGGLPTSLQRPSAQGQPPGSIAPPMRPSSATSGSSSSGERLPPLRSMEGGTPALPLPPPGGSGQAHEQDPRTGQWVPLQSRQFETGWATAPRPPPGHPGNPPR